MAEGGPCQAPSSVVQGHRSSSSATFLPVPVLTPSQNQAAKRVAVGFGEMDAGTLRLGWNTPIPPDLREGFINISPEKGGLQAVLMHECYLRFQSLRNL